MAIVRALATRPRIVADEPHGELHPAAKITGVFEELRVSRRFPEEA